MQNLSEVPHRYREPSGFKTEYGWSPGEVKTVPDGIGRLVLRAHPETFVVVRES